MYRSTILNAEKILFLFHLYNFQTQGFICVIYVLGFLLFVCLGVFLVFLSACLFFVWGIFIFFFYYYARCLPIGNWGSDWFLHKLCITACSSIYRICMMSLLKTLLFSGFAYIQGFTNSSEELNNRISFFPSCEFTYMIKSSKSSFLRGTQTTI